MQPIAAELKAAIQRHGDELVQALLALTKSDDERVRLGAIQAALDRGWGKPTQAVDLGGEMAITKIERRLRRMHTARGARAVADTWKDAADAWDW